MQINWPDPTFSTDWRDWARSLIFNLDSALNVYDTSDIGAVKEFMTGLPESGYLLANGSVFSAASYPILAQKLNSTTLPNLTATIWWNSWNKSSMKLDWIMPKDLTLDEICTLIQGAKTCIWDSMEIGELIEGALENEIYFYRMTGEASGIIIARPNWRMNRLEILLVVGKGYSKAMAKIRDQTKAVAQGLGLDHIAGWVSKNTHMAMYEKLTSAKPVATLYVERV
jgi:hypothetical protein